MRIRIGRSIFLILALVGANESIAATPPNDERKNAIQISGVGLFPFDNSTATGLDLPDLYCSELIPSPDPHFANDVWYRWTSVCPDSVTVDTCWQTTVDTKIAVYYDCGEYLEECNDNDCLYQSRVTFYAEPGFEYCIQIASYPGLGGGSGTFRITCGDKEPFPPVHPSELGCPSPSQPSPSEALETCNARDRWDAHNSTRGQYEIADEFVPDVDGTLTGLCWWGTYLRDGEECARDLVDFFEITYYADDCGALGAILAGPFSQEDVTMEVLGPIETYESFPNGAFEYQYSARHDPVQLFGGETYWISITNSYYNNCAWFWETALGGDGHAIQIDDQSEMTATIRADLAFCFRLVETDGPVCFPPPENDDCADALPLTTDGASFDTSGAITDGPVNDLLSQPYPPACYFGLSDEQVHKDVWYDVAPACSSSLHLGLCDSSFDTKIAVYEGSNCPSYESAIACNDDACGGEFERQSDLHLDVRGGAAYKVRIGGFNGDWGLGVLTLDYGPPLQVSLEHFATFARCFTSALGSASRRSFVEPCCSYLDFDADADIDLDDYARFYALLVGP